MRAIGIKQKLIGSIAVSTALLLIISAICTYGYFKKTTEKIISEKQFAIVASVARSVEVRLAATINILKIAADSYRLYTHTPENISSGGSSPRRSIQTWIQKGFVLQQVFTKGLFVLDAAGNVVVSSPRQARQLLAQSHGITDLSRASRSDNPSLSEPFLSKTDGHPLIAVTAPLRDVEGNTVYLLCGLLDLADLGELLGSSGDVLAGKTGYFYLFAPDGTIVMHPDKTKLLKKEVPSDVRKLLDSEGEGFEGSGEVLNSRGERYLVSFKRVEPTKWILAGNLLAEEAYQPVNKFKTYYTYAFVIAIVSALVGAYALGRNIVAPILSLTSQVQKLGSRKGGLADAIVIPKDLEVQILAKEFNGLLEKVKKRELELERTASELQSLIENFPGLVWLKDRDGRYLRVNMLFVRTCGAKDVSFVLGKTDIDVWPRGLVDRYMVDDHTVLASGKTTITTDAEMRQEGGSRWYRSFRTMVLSASGEILGTAGFARDITDEKALDKALHSSESRYRAIFEKNHAMMLIVDPQTGFIVDVNPSAAVFYGWAREAMRQMKIAQISTMPPEKVKTVMDSMISEREKHFILHHRLANGSIRDVEIYGTPIQEQDRMLLYAIVHDVSERMRAELALRESEERACEVNDRFKLAVESAGIGIWDFDVYSKKIIWDEHVQRLHGKNESPSELTFDGWLTAVHVDDRQALEQQVKQALANSNDFNISYRVLWPDGTIHRLKTIGKISCDESGYPARVTGIHYDITEQTRMEQAIRDSEKKYHNIFDSFVDLYYQTNLEGTILTVSPSVLHIAGYTPEELIGQNATHLYESPPDRDQLQTSLMLHGKVNDFETTLLRKDGTFVAVSITSHVVRDDRGNPQAVEGAIRDITVRKKAEEQLHKTLDELRISNDQLEKAIARAKEMAHQAAAANAAKSTFLATMSHEIRTPMNGILGMIGLLLDTDLTKDQQRFAEIVKSSADNLLMLINDVLDYSKIEAGKLQFESIDFDLRSMVDDFAAILDIRSNEKGLEFVCRVQPDVPTHFRGDPGRLRQVLINLAGNAIKFTSHGEVVVEASLLAEEAEYATVKFTVSDTGIGIAQEKMPLLFKSFSQVDSSITRKFGGTGLGLAISKQLVELMNGEIGGNSQEGKGSQFWFTVRLEKRTAPPLLSMQSAEVNNARILVVDDNAASRKKLADLFHVWNARPGEAADAEKALEALRRAVSDGDPYQAAILDKHMPGMDGIALALTIRQDPALRHTRLVLMTDIGQQGDGRRMEEIGVAAYLTKPVSQSELFDCLAVVLAGVASGNPGHRLVTKHLISEIRRSKVHILLVEDNEVNQQVALGLLQKLGLKADVAGNGAEALKALAEKNYDLVFMDVQMPVMGGFEATRRIRNAESGVRNTKIMIVAMTANAMQGDRDLCLGAGMNDYISKPVTFQTLSDVIQKWVARRNRTETAPVQAGGDVRSPAPEKGTALVFDHEGLRQRLMDDRDLEEIVLDGFLRSIPDRIAAVEDAAGKNDAETATREAHTIKGMAANVGGETLRRSASEMEKACRSGDINLVQKLIPELRRDADQLGAEIRSCRSTCV